MEPDIYSSRAILVGSLPVGGHHPVRVQSMVNTNTMDALSTVNQCVGLAEAGCEMIRITAPGVREAQQLEKIRDELRRKGYQVPLVADIHYSPKAAEVAAGIVEKVRINPGNFVDRPGSGHKRYTDKAYREELEKIAARIHPLLEICKKNKTVIRIGVNHGSLSGRIMDRFGDTPQGMVESAIEYAGICRQQGFEDLVMSLKSSDVRQMIYANRLLVKRMMDEGMHYPLHLGVTEAGDGEDGRIKSAAGIGTLLADGIGDTIRVSLTEDPVHEIPVARMITRQFALAREQQHGQAVDKILALPVSYERHQTMAVKNIGGAQAPAVSNEITDELARPGKLRVISFSLADSGDYPDIPIQQAINSGDGSPIVLRAETSNRDYDEILVRSSCLMARYLVDGFGDAVWISSPAQGKDFSQLELSILQALRLRITRTEYIACPSCGRTQFNIQDALDKIRRRTSHLKGLKIGVMGCIVNGPGEMADADYGYVGSGKGKITLYKGRDIIERNIDEANAVDRLVDLIKRHGDWQSL